MMVLSMFLHASIAPHHSWKSSTLVPMRRSNSFLRTLAQHECISAMVNMNAGAFSHGTPSWGEGGVRAPGFETWTSASNYVCMCEQPRNPLRIMVIGRCPKRALCCSQPERIEGSSACTCALKVSGAGLPFFLVRCLFVDVLFPRSVGGGGSGDRLERDVANSIESFKS